jgi:hypothetical protein
MHEPTTCLAFQPQHGSSWRWNPYTGEVQAHILQIPERPNVAVKWLERLPRIREVPGSDIDLETGYSH